VRAESLDGVLARGRGRGQLQITASPSKSPGRPTSCLLSTDVSQLLIYRKIRHRRFRRRLDRATSEKVLPKIFFSNTPTNTGAAPRHVHDCRWQTRHHFAERPRLPLPRTPAPLRPVPSRQRDQAIAGPAANPATHPVLLARHDRQHGHLGSPAPPRPESSYQGCRWHAGSLTYAPPAIPGLNRPHQTNDANHLTSAPTGARYSRQPRE
jgi:hypothetical protein